MHCTCIYTYVCTFQAIYVYMYYVCTYVCVLYMHIHIVKVVLVLCIFILQQHDRCLVCGYSVINCVYMCGILCTCVRTHVHIYIFMYIHTYTYICIHTYVCILAMHFLCETSTECLIYRV